MESVEEKYASTPTLDLTVANFLLENLQNQSIQIGHPNFEALSSVIAGAMQQLQHIIRYYETGSDYK